MWVWNATVWSQNFMWKSPHTFHLAVTEVAGPVSGERTGTFTHQSKQKIQKLLAMHHLQIQNEDLSFQL